MSRFYKFSFAFIFCCLGAAFPIAAQPSCIDPALINPNAICYMIYAPVCGCDDVTYPNDCVAANSGVTSFTPGECTPGNGSSCNAYFGYYADSTGLLVEFFDFDLSNSYYDFAFWDFGDGNTLMSSPFSSVHHLYATTGLYPVCLTIFTSDSSCFSTYCETIAAAHSWSCTDSSVINPMMACPEIYDPVCGMCDGITYSSACVAFYHHGIVSFTAGECDFYYPCDAKYYYWEERGDSSVYVVHFGSYPNSNPNGMLTDATFFWEFGDGATSTEPFPVHVYGDTSVKSYFVCLTVTDTVIGCAVTFCDSVFTGYSDYGCYAWFDYSIDPGGTVIASPDSSANGNWYWVTPDGATSNAPNLSFPVDSVTGDTVCIVVVNSLLNCSDTFCVSGMEMYMAYLQSGVKNPAESISALRVYPNPSAHEATLEITMLKTAETSVIVRNLLGAAVETIPEMRIDAGLHKIALNTASLNAGVYIVEVITPVQRSFIKMAVVR